jgi:hypothetical protein
MKRRFGGLVAAAALAAAAYGCGGASGPSVSSGAHRRVQPAGNDQAATRTVQYQGVAFDVPADWEVHDLARDPTTCVRFDVHAVYLGTPGPDMNCPAQVVGHTDALLVQPADQAAGVSSAGVAATAQDVNGLSVEVADNTASSGQIDATTNGVSLTFMVGDGNGTAQRILQSVRTAGS